MTNRDLNKKEQPKEMLIIGYGNDLLGDDAAGRKVADLVASRKIPGVRSLSLIQLTPELADDISKSRVVIFVDASHQTTTDGIEVVPIAPQADGTSVTHHFSPEGLLLMAQQLYGHCPSAWCIYIPARSFELGAEMTKDAAACVQDALRIIMNFIGSFGYIPDED